MKLDKVRIGERFVFDHIGGVYSKISPDKARCVYGKDYGKIEPILPDMSVYVIFEDRSKFKRRPMGQKPESQETPVDAPGMPQNESSAVVTPSIPVPSPEPAKEPVSLPEPAIGVAVCNIPYSPKSDGTMKMVLVDDEDKVIAEIPNASAAQIAAYSDAEGVRMQDKHNARNVIETLVDHVTQTIYVVLGDEV